MMLSINDGEIPGRDHDLEAAGHVHRLDGLVAERRSTDYRRARDPRRHTSNPDK